jgi:hypothetical protein
VAARGGKVVGVAAAEGGAGGDEVSVGTDLQHEGRGGRRGDESSDFSEDEGQSCDYMASTWVRRTTF